MRTIVLLVTTLLSFGFLQPEVVNAQTPQPVLHLAFDGSVVDSTGLNPSIEVNGGAFVADRNGKPNSAYYFDGKTDNIQILDANDRINEISDDSGITFMSWIRLEEYSKSTRSVIIERIGDSSTSYWESTGYAFGINNTGQLFINGSNSLNDPRLYSSNEWKHIALTIKNGFARFYVNGEFYNEKRVGALQYSNGSTIRIGLSEYVDQGFKGALDELQVYDVVVEDNVIRDAAGIGPVIDEQILFIPFSNTINDSSRYEFQLFEALVTEEESLNFVNDRFSRSKKALSFEDTPLRISLSSRKFNEVFNHKATFSLNLWLFLTAYPNDNFGSTIIQIPYTSNNIFRKGMSLTLDKFGRLKFYTGNKYLLTNYELPQKRWFNLTITYDGSEIKLFIDGKEDTESYNHTVSFGVQIKGSEGSLLIGNSAFGNGAFEQIIDDISLYNYVLSDEEISEKVDFRPEIKETRPSELLSINFDETLIDDSELKNVLDIQGGTFGPDRNGKLDQAYRFSDEDYIRIVGSSNKLDSLKSEVSVSTWIKSDSFSEVENYSKIFLFSKEDQRFADKLELLIYKPASGYNRFYFNINGKSTFHESLEILDENWIHLAGTYNGEVIKLFLNGNLVKEETYKTTLSLFESEVYLAGKETYFEDEVGFSGYLDDFHFYNYALSDSSIEKLYDINKEGRIFRKEKMVHLSFDNQVFDSSENRNTIEVTGTSFVDDRFKTKNSAISFDGFNDLLKIKDENSELDSVYSGLTVSFWVKPENDKNTEMTVLSRKDDSGFNEFGVEMHYERAIFKINNSKMVSGFKKYLHNGEWYLITCTFDGSTTKIFINDELSSSSTYSGRINLNDADIFIGNNEENSQPFKGVLDNLKIFNYAISDTLIESMYENRFKGYDIEPLRLLSLKFENNLIDSSGFNNHVFSEGGNFTNDRFRNANNAFSFNGANEFIYIEDVDNIIDSLSYGLTISTWVKISNFSRANSFDEILIAREDSRFNRYQLKIVDQGLNEKAKEVKFIIDDQSVDFPVVTDNWHHLAGSYNGNFIKLYINGILVKYIFYDGLLEASESNIYIGNSSAGDQPFYGDLDEIQIYNYALSDSAIAAMIDVEVLPVSDEEEPEIDIPSKIELLQNYPNPFNPSTQIEFYLPESNEVLLTIFDSIGREIEVLVQGRLSSGRHIYTFNASQLSTGVYFYRLVTEAGILTRKMLLIK